jgi:hypothetical protein
MNGQVLVALLHVRDPIMSAGENLEILTVTLMKMIVVSIVILIVIVTLIVILIVIVSAVLKTVTLMIADAIGVVVDGEDVAAVVELEDDALVV